MYTQTPLKVLPDFDGRLNSFAFLSCIIEPKNATVDTRWLLPSGEFVTAKNASLTGRLKVKEGEIARSNGNVLGTVLFIQNVSYKDGGLYTCEVREVDGERCECENEWPAVTSTELQFQGEHMSTIRSAMIIMDRPMFNHSSLTTNSTLWQ